MEVSKIVRAVSVIVNAGVIGVIIWRSIVGWSQLTGPGALLVVLLAALLLLSIAAALVRSDVNALEIAKAAGIVALVAVCGIMTLVFIYFLVDRVGGYADFVLRGIVRAFQWLVG